MPVGQHGSTTSLASLVENLASMKTDIINLETKLEIRGEKSTSKRKELTNSDNVTKPKVTKPNDRQQQNIYDKIKEDTSKFLSVTQKITNENKQEWILLMEQSQQNNNCMGKTQRKKMHTLWNNFNI